MNIVIAIITWLVVNFFLWWFEFNSMLCFLAGLFLIMPALLKFDFKDLFILKKYKLITFLNLVFNFILIPAIFYSIWYFFFDTEYIRYAFLLLGLLSWGGLLLAWADKTDANIKLTFSLFILNFIIFSLIFFPLNDFLLAQWDLIKNIDNSNIPVFWQNILNNQNTWNTCAFSKVITSCWFAWWNWPSPIAAFFALILIPFIVSRFIRFSEKLTKKLLEKIKIVSKISTFLVIFYIFSLKDIHNIFNFDLYSIFIFSSFLLLAYLIVYSFMYFTYVFLWKTQEAKSLFWVVSTRFITIWLLFSFVYSVVFWLEFLLLFTLSYFIQIFLSVMFTKVLSKKN